MCNRAEKQCLKSILVTNSFGQIQLDAGCFVDANGGAFVIQIAGGKVHGKVNYVTPWFMEISEAPEHFHISESLHVQCVGALSPEFKYSECHSGKMASGFVRKTWKLIREHYDALPKDARKKNYQVHFPAMLQIRKIARIDAVTTFGYGDGGKHFDDSVGVAADWRKPEPV